MRKVLIALVILAVGLSGLLIWHCSGIEMESNQVRIGVTVYQMEDPFIAQIPQYIEKIAKEYGCLWTWWMPWETRTCKTTR